LTSAYVFAAPNYDAYAGGCGELEQNSDHYEVLIPLDDDDKGRAAIEVLDPLCAACKAFEQRLDVSEMDDELDRRLLLFPLDDECNWMVSTAMHPGACQISEAILC